MTASCDQIARAVGLSGHEEVRIERPAERLRRFYDMSDTGDQFGAAMALQGANALCLLVRGLAAALRVCNGV